MEENKTFIAHVDISISQYMQEESNPQEKTVLHTVSAKDESEARDKIYKYYEEETTPYSVYYSVNDIEIAIHIE